MSQQGHLSDSNLTEGHIMEIRPQENLSLKSPFPTHKRIYQETFMRSRDPVKILMGLRMFIALWAADGEGCYKLQLLRLC